MRIAVTGPYGRLGSELVRCGCIPITANICNFHSLRQELDYLNPDVIINSASYTDVDGCENAPKRAAEVNTYGVYVLSQVFSGKIIQISTDYIFDGESGPYPEDARPNPINIYGWSKLGGELILKNRPDSLIIRTTILFDHYSYNFVTAIIRKLLGGETITVPDALFGSPTYIPHLAEAILSATELTGVINITGNRVISRLRFARMIAKKFGHGVTSIFSGPATGRALRPRYAGLKVDKAQRLGLPIYDPLDGVREVLNALEKVAVG